jgi:hypothetical protein
MGGLVFVDYNPEKHKGLPLYEIQSEERGGDRISRLVKTSVSHEVAAKVPWYYMVEVSEEDEKGGPGSGFFGHSGRPGKVGGSAPTSGAPTRAFDTAEWLKDDMGTRRDKWEKLSAREQDKLADAANQVPVNQERLLAHAGERPEFDGDIKAAISNRLKAASSKDGEDYIPSGNSATIGRTANEMDDVLEELGVDPKLRHELAMEAVDALVAQDYESMGRTLGDHGIHHIRGNIDLALGILEEHPGEDTAEDIAATYISQVFHDTGYLTDPSRIFLDMGHARWGTQHYDSNLRPLVESALGKRAAGEISHIMRTHAATDIDWEEDVVASAARVADNLALFHKEKFPPLLRFAPGATDILEDLGKGDISASTARSRLRSAIRASDLSPTIQKQLAKSVSEVSDVTPKFTLGMLGGSVDRVSWSDNHLNVFLKRSPEATRLQKVLDLGQRQFGKLASIYGASPEQFIDSLEFEFKDPRGQTLLQSFIEEEKARMLKALGLTVLEKKEITETLKLTAGAFPIALVEALKGGPGSGHHGHTGRPGQRGGSAPGRADAPRFQIGITSAREGRPLSQIKKEMGQFREALGATSVENLSVELGTGAWEGGSEPTWVTRYRGNGAATKVLAATGKKHNQDAVLVMRRTRAGEEGQPLSEFLFKQELDTTQFQAIGDVLAANGFGGWTWGRRGGKTLLQIAHIPEWSDFDVSGHRAASEAVKDALSGMGYAASLGTEQIQTTIMDDSNYDDFISGARTVD